MPTFGRPIKATRGQAAVDMRGRGGEVQLPSGSVQSVISGKDTLLRGFWQAGCAGPTQIIKTEKRPAPLAFAGARRKNKITKWSQTET